MPIEHLGRELTLSRDVEELVPLVRAAAGFGHEHAKRIQIRWRIALNCLDHLGDMHMRPVFGHEHVAILQLEHLVEERERQPCRCDHEYKHARSHPDPAMDQRGELA